MIFSLKFVAGNAPSARCSDGEIGSPRSLQNWIDSSRPLAFRVQVAAQAEFAVGREIR